METKEFPGKRVKNPSGDHHHRPDGFVALNETAKAVAAAAAAAEVVVVIVVFRKVINLSTPGGTKRKEWARV